MRQKMCDIRMSYLVLSKIVVIGYWGCAAGRGHIFTTPTDYNRVVFSSIFNRVTRMGRTFSGLSE